MADPQPSPKKHHAPEPPPTPPMPQSHLTSLYGPPKPPRAISPVRAPSPKRSPAPPAPSGSPKVSTYKVELQTPNRPQSPKFQHQVRKSFLIKGSRGAYRINSGLSLAWSTVTNDFCSETSGTISVIFHIKHLGNGR